MEQHTNVIEEISQIENQANDIMSAASAEKEYLAKEHEARMKSFDENLQKETQSKVEEIRTSLKAQNQIDLDQQRAKTMELLGAMQDEYDNAHTQIARKIVKSMIGAL